MDKEKFTKALEKLFTAKGHRKFTQSVDLIVNLKDMDIKKNDQQVDFFAILPHPKGKSAKICGLVGAELHESAKTEFDNAIESHDFDKYTKDVKSIKKLANEYDFFVAQANIMPQIATVFGKVLGPRGKMPNPKAGCVVSQKAVLKPLKEKLNKTVRVSAKTSLSVKAVVGNESQDQKEIIDNIVSVYNSLVSNTPQGINNIKNIYLKFTMSAPVRVE